MNNKLMSSNLPEVINILALFLEALLFLAMLHLLFLQDKNHQYQFVQKTFSYNFFCVEKFS